MNCAIDAGVLGHWKTNIDGNEGQDLLHDGPGNAKDRAARSIWIFSYRGKKVYRQFG